MLDFFFGGVKQRVVLIYMDFITREECFRNACLLLTTPSRACMHAVRVLSSLMKDYSLVFSMKSGGGEREKTLKDYKEADVNDKATNRGRRRQIKQHRAPRGRLVVDLIPDLQICL